MLPENEYSEFEGRVYSNPQVGIDETNAFIDNFRNTQQQNTQQISADTQALGTDVPSSLGGLTGAGSYFTSRYQTPQTNTLLQDLRTTAQATALNEVLENEQAKWKKLYQDTYRAYQKRQHGKVNTTTPSTPNTTTTGGVDETPTDDQGGYIYSGSIASQPGYYSVISPDGYVHLVDMETGEETSIAPPKNTTGTGSSGMGWSGGGAGGGGGGGGRVGELRLNADGSLSSRDGGR